VSPPLRTRAARLLGRTPDKGDEELRWWLEVWEPHLRGGQLWGPDTLELSGDAAVADTYDGRRVQQARAEVRRVLAEAGIDDPGFFDGKVVVDVGSGPLGFPDAVGAATSISVDPLHRRYAESGLLDAGSRAVYLSVGAEDIPLPDGTVDVVVSRNNLDHVDDPAIAAAEMIRLLRPGGTLILSVDVDHPPTAAEPHELSHDAVRRLLTPLETVSERELGDGHGGGRQVVFVARRSP
jgi:SAM-dependent methyltransferase